MQRELPRTIETLMPRYQRGIEKEEYEVIVIDNGSEEPLIIEREAYSQSNLQIISVENPKVSPVSAINEAVKQSRGRTLRY